MEVVYLGLISKIFNAIFNAILAPVFKFISSLLETVLGWLFRTILQPLLINVLQPLFKGLVDLIMEILGGIIYSIYADCLQIVDALQTSFRIFAGLDEVTYKGRSYSLLEVIFRMETIQKATYILIAVSFALMMLFAILGVLRSMADLDGADQRPVSKVLSMVFKAMTKMFMIPAVSLFAIMMSCQILAGISSALGGESTTLARMVFVVSSLDACKESKYNVSGGGTNIGIDDPVRKNYYDGTYSYTNKSQVKKDFDLGKFDYMLGFLGAGFLIIVLAICMISFITRIFDVIVLFIVSPFFAAVMPLDDGEKFKAWQDMFVAKLFGGYGSVVGMQVYMMLCPAVMGGSIVFGQGSTEANYLIRMIFLMGGAWAVVKVGPTITQLLNFQAGAAESEHSRSMMTATAMAGNAAVGLGKTSVQAYQGWKGKKDTAMAASDKRIQDRLNPSRAGQSSGGQGGNGSRNTVTSPRITQKGPGQAQRTGTMFKGHITTNKTEGGHSYLGVDFKHTKFGRDENGRFNARLLGVGVRKGQDGKVDKISLPFVRLKRDDNGKMRVAKVKTPAGVNIKRAETLKKNPDGTTTRTMGRLYCSDIKVAGYKARFDQNTGNVETLSKFGTHYAKNENGQYVMTHTQHFGVRREFEQDADGKYKQTHRVGNFTESSYSYDGNQRISQVEKLGNETGGGKTT